jgi:hypothetical protein
MERLREHGGDERTNGKRADTFDIDLPTRILRQSSVKKEQRGFQAPIEEDEVVESCSKPRLA